MCVLIFGPLLTTSGWNLEGLSQARGGRIVYFGTTCVMGVDARTATMSHVPLDAALPPSSCYSRTCNPCASLRCRPFFGEVIETWVYASGIAEPTGLGRAQSQRAVHSYLPLLRCSPTWDTPGHPPQEKTLPPSAAPILPSVHCSQAMPPALSSIHASLLSTRPSTPLSLAHLHLSTPPRTNHLQTVIFFFRRALVCFETSSRKSQYSLHICLSLDLTRLFGRPLPSLRVSSSPIVDCCPLRPNEATAVRGGRPASDDAAALVCARRTRTYTRPSPRPSSGPSSHRPDDAVGDTGDVVTNTNTTFLLASPGNALWPKPRLSAARQSSPCRRWARPGPTPTDSASPRAAA